MGELAVLEQIAMYLTALPAPPLPMFSDTVAKEERHASSHDILAGLLVIAMQRRRPDLDAARKAQQLRIIQTLISTLDAEPVPSTPEEEVGFRERALQAYRRFTADFIEAFTDGGGPAVRFAPLAEVTRESKVHRGCGSYMAAQDILHQQDPTCRRTAEAWCNEFSYEELIAQHAKRIIGSAPKSTGA